MTVVDSLGVGWVTVFEVSVLTVPSGCSDVRVLFSMVLPLGVLIVVSVVLVDCAKAEAGPNTSGTPSKRAVSFIVKPPIEQG